MKIVGTVDIFNRLAQSTGFGASSRLGKPCKGVLQVRNRTDGKNVLVVSTKREIGAHEYDVRNIQTFRTQFIRDGFATIEITQPPMNIMLRNCNPEELRVFIEDLRKIRGDKKICVKGSATDPTASIVKTAKQVDEVTEKPGSLRRNASLKRARSPELSKTETAKIKKILDSSDRVISVKTRAKYPDEFKDTVEHITIKDVRLRRIDQRIYKLTWLNHLDLSGNCLKDLEPLKKLNGCLKVLNLGKNEIRSLPDDVFESRPLLNLVRLDLSQNMLEKIPSSISRLHALTDANFGGNQIRYLPYNWMDLKNLRSLNLSRNKLLFAPATILNLPLMSLDMSDNPDLHKPKELKTDYVGYSCLPTLFETACEVLMNIHRRNRCPLDESLPAIIKDYLNGGKYCMECGKISLKYEIIKDSIVLRSGALSACTVSPALEQVLVKKIICAECVSSLPRSRKTKIIF